MSDTAAARIHAIW